MGNNDATEQLSIMGLLTNTLTFFFVICSFYIFRKSTTPHQGELESSPLKNLVQNALTKTKLKFPEGISNIYTTPPKGTGDCVAMTAHMIENIFELRQNQNQNQNQNQKKIIDDICFFRILLKRMHAQEGEVLHCFLVVGPSSEEFQIQNYIMNQLDPTKVDMAPNTTAYIVDAWATCRHKTWAGEKGLFAVKDKSLGNWLEEILQHPLFEGQEPCSYAFIRSQIRATKTRDSDENITTSYRAEDLKEEPAETKHIKCR